MKIKEIHSTVEFYGHGEIIKKYSKFPTNFPLPVGVQHGWMHYAHSADFLEDGDKVFMKPTTF